MKLTEPKMKSRVSAHNVHDFVVRAMRAVHVCHADAQIVADVLTAADLRGIDSHGIARLKQFYVDPIRSGGIDPNATSITLSESATAISLDAKNGLGHPISVYAMNEALAAAAQSGVALATVRNSNHHGATSYYAMKALERGMIGLAMTNTPHVMVPTFGREAVLGTNPIAVAVPGANGDAFVLDIATSAVAYGKLELASRAGRELEPGWAVDNAGRPTVDAAAGLSGALVPLGGPGVEGGGHKGYGLSLMVELLTGILAGGLFGDALPSRRDFFDPPGAMSHLFIAIDIAHFRAVDEFESDVHTLLNELRESQPADGSLHVYAPGDLEVQTSQKRLEHGIEIDPTVLDSIDQLADELAIARLHLEQ